ncbi:MAG TPA: YqaJ viral recombinase family protein [bacterium]|nr:YqaJ viral recombinase family protein [bacterium]
MPITEHQREVRRRYIGASDAAAVLGLDPYRNPSDVYHEKVTDLEPDESSEAATIGQVLEDGILDWGAKERGVQIVKNQFRVHENGIMSIHYDALVKGNIAESMECKTAGILTPFDREEWGEVGTDEIPTRYIIQCQQGFSILPELQTTWVPVLLGGVGLRMYRVDRNDEMVRFLEEFIPDFHHKHIVQKVPPVDPPPSMEVLKRIKRMPATTVPIDPALVTAWQDAKKVAKSAGEAEDLAKRAVLAALGDAEGAHCELGAITYLETHKKSYVVKESSYRTLRFKEEKAHAKAS